MDYKIINSCNTWCNLLSNYHCTITIERVYINKDHGICTVAERNGSQLQSKLQSPLFHMERECSPYIYNRQVTKPVTY